MTINVLWARILIKQYEIGLRRELLRKDPSEITIKEKPRHKTAQQGVACHSSEKIALKVLRIE